MQSGVTCTCTCTVASRGRRLLKPAKYISIYGRGPQNHQQKAIQDTYSCAEEIGTSRSFEATNQCLGRDWKREFLAVSVGNFKGG
jgi:hypothetical protein